MKNRSVFFWVQFAGLFLASALAGFWALRFGDFETQGRLLRYGMALLSAAVVFLTGLSLLFRRTKWLNLLWKHRYLAGCAVAVLYTVLALNASSIDLWRNWLGSASSSSILWGRARSIRSDEWAVWTPFLLSQNAQGFPAVNGAIGGGGVNTVWVSVGGLPAWNTALPFKPLYWPVLLLGTEYGYSLMCILRTLLLFFVSEKTARLYTGGNRRLSVAAAFLLTLSPYVQWWYSQSICEILIFGQGILLALHHFLETKETGKSLLHACLAAWCFGCFLMVAYPAWIIPAGYLVLAVAVYRVVRSRKLLTGKKVCFLLLPLVLSLAWLAVVVVLNREPLLAVLQSEYPGSRLYTGGKWPRNLLTGLYALLLPIQEPAVESASELSCFLSFAPAGLILALWQGVKNKKWDRFSLLLLITEAVFCVFQLAGAPAWLARFTLLSQCTRPVLVIGVADTVLLLRQLSLPDRPESKSFALLCALVCAAGSGLLCYAVFKAGLKYAVLIAALALVLYGMILHVKLVRQAAFALCVAAVLGGLFVNPLNRGLTGSVERLGLVRTLAQADTDSASLYAVEGDWPLTEVPLLAGKRVLNSTQPYPDPEKWQAVDPDNSYYRVYNRMCHVSLRIGEETAFTLLHEDAVQADLTLENLQTLGVTHLLTRQELPAGQGELTGESDGWRIYRLASR